MKFKSYLLIAALALVTACAGNPNPNEPYPFAPQFVSPQQVPPTVLKPPPRPGSKTYARELNLVLNTQKYLTQDDKDEAMRQDHITIQKLIYPAIGEEFSELRYPETYALLRRAGSDAWRIGDVARVHWKSTRPWLADKRVQLYVKPIHSGSYPSGHTLTNHVWARILGDLMPEHRVALIMRADDIANTRVKGGAHYFFDVHAGIRMSDIVYCQMKKSPEFRDALLRARNEVRRHDRLVPSINLRRCAA